MLFLIARGITLGFTAGVLPGPLQTYLINTTLLLGWRRSLIIIFAPLIMDGPLIVLVLFFFRQFPPELLRGLQIAGGLFVLWLAWGAWKQVRAGVSIGPGEDGAVDSTQRQIMARAVLMNVLSPAPYVFWTTVNGPLLIQGLQQSIWHGLAFLVSFYGTFLFMMSLIVFLFDRLRRLDERVTRAVLLITVVVLVFFGLSLLAQGLGLIA